MSRIFIYVDWVAIEPKNREILALLTKISKERNMLIIRDSRQASLKIMENILYPLMDVEHGVQWLVNS